jgi:hypothetical protein
MNASARFAAALALLAVSCNTESDPVAPVHDGGNVQHDAPVADTDAGADAPVSFNCVAVEAPTACPDPPPRFADVAPIFGSRCVTPCHNGAPNGPWPLVRYEHISDWQDDVRAHLLGCTMPPLDAGIPITAEEKTLILTWILCGLPQ